jgi:hypothetical protein
MATLSVGMVVVALDPLRGAKWDALYVGPYTTVGVDDRRAYVLRDEMDTVVTRHFSVDQLQVATATFVGTSPGLVAETILVHRHDSSCELEYLVWWKGYSPDENSWEPVVNFVDRGCIQKYWKGHGTVWGGV